MEEPMDLSQDRTMKCKQKPAADGTYTSVAAACYLHYHQQELCWTGTTETLGTRVLNPLDIFIELTSTFLLCRTAQTAAFKAFKVRYLTTLSVAKII